MGYKEDKELYEEYMGALVDSDASFQQRKEKMEEIFGADVGLDHVNSAFEYIAKVEYDDENRVFTGSVINTKTVITFYGSSVGLVIRRFEREWYA